LAEALIILVAIATAVAVFFLLVFSLLARREHRLKSTKRHASREEMFAGVCGARGAGMTSDEVLARLQGSKTDLGRFVAAMLRNQRPHLIVPTNAVRAWQAREPGSWAMVRDWLAEQGKSVVLIEAPCCPSHMPTGWMAVSVPSWGPAPSAHKDHHALPRP
jgi:hypothetical protein